MNCLLISGLQLGTQLSEKMSTIASWFKESLSNNSRIGILVPHPVRALGHMVLRGDGKVSYTGCSGTVGETLSSQLREPGGGGSNVAAVLNLHCGVKTGTWWIFVDQMSAY